jgi:hypothetical protein
MTTPEVISYNLGSVVTRLRRRVVVRIMVGVVSRARYPVTETYPSSAAFGALRGHNLRSTKALYEVGTNAFLRLARGEPLAKVIDDLLPEYAVERSVLGQDLIQLLNALRDRGIIQIERPPGQ